MKLNISRGGLVACVAGLSCSLFASSAWALDLYDTRYAALDQPQINAAFALTEADRAANNFLKYDSFKFDPNTFDLIDIEAVSVPGYFDTGASSVLLSTSTRASLNSKLPPGTGITDTQFAGQTVHFGDVGVGGGDTFTVSPEVYISLAPNIAYTAATPEDKTVFTQKGYGPTRIQIGPVGSGAPAEPPFDLLDTGFDVYGMPLFQNKVVVMDARPSNNQLLPSPDPSIEELTMRTYAYNPGTPFNPAQLDTNPGIVPTELQVKLSYGDFSGYTSVDPAGAPTPSMFANPFIGPNPDGTNPGDSTPPAIVGFGTAPNQQVTLLLDTGGSVSLLSKAVASSLGVEVEGTASNPVLTIVDPGNPSLRIPVSDQFTLTITGVGGDETLVGFYLDDLIIPTTNGENIHYHGAPFFIHDITVEDPITHAMITLDGVFGMNYLFGSAEIEYLDLGGFVIPFPVNENIGHFNWATFDQANGLLGVGNSLTVVPEPASGVLLVIGAALAARRRRK